MRRLILAILLIGCAQPGYPPGGPERKIPPELLAVKPESGAVNVKEHEVSFQFDEVLSEQPGGVQDLRQLVLISPWDGEANVGWHRSRLTIKGRTDLKPNTTYVVTILPGLADLRGNVRKEKTTVVFSTGPAIPDTRISGVVFDWAAGTPLVQAAVQAIHLPDSTTYVARTDSSGRFSIAFLPPARYTIRAFTDLKNTLTLQRRVPWDSVDLTLQDSARVELYAFIHDTLPPRIESISSSDSLTIRVKMDQPLDTALVMDTSLFTLRRADSSVVALKLVEAAARYDSTHAVVPRADTTQKAPAAGQRPPAGQPPARGPGRTPGDTAHRVTGPRPSRRIPVSDLVIVPAQPLAAGASYRLEARALKNLLGVAGRSSRVFEVPKAAPPAKVPAKPPGKKPAAVPAKPPASPPADTGAPAPAKPDTSARPPRI